MFDGDPDFGRLCPFELGIKEPDLFNFDVGFMQMSNNGVLGRTGRVKSGDTKLPVPVT